MKLLQHRIFLGSWNKQYFKDLPILKISFFSNFFTTEIKTNFYSADCNDETNIINAFANIFLQISKTITLLYNVCTSTEFIYKPILIFHSTKQQKKITNPTNQTHDQKYSQLLSSIYVYVQCTIKPIFTSSDVNIAFSISN